MGGHRGGEQLIFPCYLISSLSFYSVFKEIQLLVLLQGDLDKAWTFLLVLLGPSPAPGKGSSYSM